MFISFVSFISTIFVVNYNEKMMGTIDYINKPTKEEQRAAMESYSALAETIKQLKSDIPEIEIEETKEQIKIPIKALKLLSEVLEAMGKGQPISIVPLATEVTTQKAAEIIGCSRPFLVKLLEEGKITFTKVGRHRRIKLEDVLEYKEQQKRVQKQHLIEMMKNDEELGLYDS